MRIAVIPQKLRVVRSPDYNYDFNIATGDFARWGHSFEDDPDMAPAPEIADIEISTGACSMKCPWCYKSNGTTEDAKHMSLETFKTVIDKFPPTLTQVALGITDASANPDFVAIMEYCHEKNIAPNYTTSGAGITEYLIQKTAELCGVVCVSVYPHNVNTAFRTVERLHNAGLEQINIHLLYHAQNISFVMRSLLQAKQFEYLNAAVFLGLKPRGDGSNMHPASYEDFCALVNYAEQLGVPYGFDSCSAHKFIRWAKENGHEDQLIFAEPCESSLFSIYVNVDGHVFPCSFTEDGEGYDLTQPDSTLKQAWQTYLLPFRKRLLANERRCPVYKID